MRRRDLAFVPGALLLAAVVVARQGEVIAQGRLLPFFETYEVSQVRILGVELYVDTSTSAGDAATAAVLAIAAGLLLRGWWRLRRPPGDAFFTAGAGALLLAIDDLVAGHETIGHNLGFLADLPLVDHPDDALVGVYGLVAAAFVLADREVWARVPRAPAAVALVAGAAAVMHDVSPLHLRRLEEGLEILAAVALLTTIAGLVRREAAIAGV